MIKTYRNEFDRYKVIGEKAIRQLSEESLNHKFSSGSNSVGMIVRHVSGNFISRFTDFLTTDGEKPWRNRESEFAAIEYDREQIEKMWSQGWETLYQALDSLQDSDLPTQVTIRQQALSVDEALARSLAHVSYHVGQIVVLAKVMTADKWEWITVPKGKSQEYNQNPTMEKGFQS